MANKRLVRLIPVLLLISLLSVSMVSAGWFGDFWNKYFGKNIVGKAIYQSPETTSNVQSSPLSWDWRNVHGENWLTPNKSQSPARIGACAEFAFVDSFESQINLYYNQHLNLDLSEQMKIDCNHGTSPLNLSSSNQLVDELCSPFVNRDIFCNGQFQSTQEDKCCNLPYLCNSWKNRIWKSLGLDICDIPPYSSHRNCLNFWDFDSNEKIKQAEEEVKRLLISKGPIHTHIAGMAHSMLLIGYKENRSDWKTLQMCGAGTEMCVVNRGCISRTCNPGESSFVSYNFDPHYNEMRWINYSCREYGNTGIYQWTMVDYGGYPSTLIPNNTCDPLLYGYSSGGRFNSYLQHAPGNGDVIWIFRNSIGGNFEEWSLDVRQFGVLTMPSGPFIPPTNNFYWPVGFTNNPKCFDNDNDGYCNWGISDIGLNYSWRLVNCPISCNDKPEKDCNDANPSLGPFDENFSCKQIFCNDSDSGQYYYLKGFVSTNFNGQNPNNKIYDDCQIPDPTGLPQWNGNYSCSGTQCKVAEFYCQGNKGAYTSFYSCPYGCQDGACLSNPKYTLTCQKASKYYKSWHTNACSSYACGKNKYLGCEKRWLRRYYYREVCQSLTTYNTSCSTSSTCGSDKEIKRTTC